MANQNMTRFKAMSMDEQVEMIEQSSQEALRSKEEIKASKTTEARRRGFILIEGAQIIIHQLQHDLDLVEMTRVPVHDPVEIQGELSGLEPIQIEETTGSNNLEAPPPQVGSPGEVSAQPKMARKSGRTSIPNPLFDLITIYDDEESSEVSLVTPVKITEDKNLRKHPP